MQFRPRVIARKGFTLIELLVVIAIIAILAAILFPVFAQARDKARSISCLSNVKQVGLGFMMYVQDWDETFPIAWGYPDGSTWFTAVYPYVKNGATPNPDYPKVAGSRPYLDNRATGMFHCPSDSDGPATLSYTTNANLMGTGQNPPRPAKSIAAINLPADLVAFGETSKPWFQGRNYDDTGTDFVSVRSDNLGSDVNLDETGEPANQWYNRNYQCKSNDISDKAIDPNNYGWKSKYLKFRHSRSGAGTGNANIAFADGHAKAIRFGQLSGKNWLPLLNSDSVNNTKFTGTCPPCDATACEPVYDNP